jgi:hypothetical protein
MKRQLEDTLFIKHGITAIDIKRQFTQHQLEHDPEV